MTHIKVKVFSSAKKEIVEKIADDQFRLFIKEPAQNNMANKAVLHIIAQELGITAQELSIITGHRSQNKILGRRTQDAGRRTQDAGRRTQDAGRLNSSS